MQTSAHAAPRRALTVLTALAAAVACMVPLAGSASAHGSIVDPASRNYGCWDRWGDDHLNEDMAEEDPMCWQAWQDNPNAMWNWNGLYQNNVNGNHQAAVPSGTLCSGGHAEGGRYDSLDTPGEWKTTSIGDNFTLNLYDQASHGADYFEVYVSKNSYDPTSEPLGWEDLDHIKTTGSYAPAQDIQIPVSTSGYDGRHVIFTIWKASHMDQNYYICSDVDFG
ncbi:lytic polysaccharide monooxygenase auxiliary activity family 9 protein [Streptomonospora wellingtoniae]|uniref:Lytic polysaccharide monooxygenase n=1 Tax=Streptomonospora wellingtoniae TaxID=3075544 RepID=A0ABU2KR32_9ACTN|nr:lytic polysaccharide monooxygenase [Streptomonospora sp. DSM 45055]MDT0301583.1 lytic polysaccharide monooxygenase [Streptomonospora sp. DSM 45055]